MPADRAPRDEHCDICGRTTTWRFAIRNSRDYVLRLIHLRSVDFWICQSCGLVEQIPAVPAALVKQVYQLPEFRPDAAAVSRKASEMVKTVPDQCAWITAHLPPGPTSTVIDVGAATGALLDPFRAAGWQTAGIEPTAHFAEFARASGHDVRTGYLEDASFGDRRFDLILVSHVLEHIPEPLMFLDRLKALMHPSSTLFVEVPDVLRPYGNIWGLFFQAGHVRHYHEATLHRLLARCGLHVWSASHGPRGVRVLARLEAPPVAVELPTIAPAAVADAITRYRRETFTRRYVRDHLHWDIKLGLRAMLRAAFGASRGQRAFDGLRRWARAAWR